MSGFSEFSYGYALTRELDGGSATGLAPIFPNLYEEGKTGGYDVMLNNVVPVFLQFKLSRKLTATNAREHKQHGEKLPYLRFGIRPQSRSDQHRLLHELEEAGNLVLYVAPEFDSSDELNGYYSSKSVHKHTAAFRPSAIGHKDSSGSHHVTPRPGQKNGTVYSTPKPIEKFPLETLKPTARERWRSKRRARGNTETLEELLRLMEIEIPSRENAHRTPAERLSIPSAKTLLSVPDDAVSWADIPGRLLPPSEEPPSEQLMHDKRFRLIHQINKSAMTVYNAVPLWFVDEN